MDEYWEAYDGREPCGHRHHSERSARRCAEHNGWTGVRKVCSEVRGGKPTKRGPAKKARWLAEDPEWSTNISNVDDYYEGGRL